MLAGQLYVPIKSFCVELLAIDFLNTWQYRGKTTVYYDWMVRDFLYSVLNFPLWHR